MVTLQSYAEVQADQVRELPGFRNFSLPGVKERVECILNMIGRVDGIFSTYTIHDITHVDAMLTMLDWIIPPLTKNAMTPVDWLMIVLAIYLHDLGMVVSSEEFIKRNENPKFYEFIDDLSRDTEGQDYIDRTEKMTSEEKDRFFYEEFIRKEHPLRISEWITGRYSSYWGDTLTSIASEIADFLKELPSRFKENLATVCESHHKDNLDKTEFYPLCQRYGNNLNSLANVQYAALILRTVDLIHVTKDRTPSVMYKLIRLSDPKGVDEWKKQQDTFSVYMKGREFDPNNLDSHVIMVGADFKEERPYFVLTEYLAYADAQIKNTKRCADISQGTPDGKLYNFPWNAVKGDIRVEGHEPVPLSFELDKGRLLDLLVGHTIYNDPTVAVRELLQNAIDAVRYYHYIHKKEVKETNQTEMSTGKVVVRWDEINRELIVDDDGIGMDLDTIKYHLMSVGSSFYNTAQFNAEHSDFSPISRFGIGILTCFMVSDDIEIVTCANNSGGYRIRMTSVHAEYLLKKLEPGEAALKGLEPHGTRVKLKFRKSVDLKDKNMLDIVRYWIILPACKVIYKENDQETNVGFNNIVEALEDIYLKSRPEKQRSSRPFEILQAPTYSNGDETYELAYIVVGGGFTPERNFLTKRSSEAPSVCIEGIRADSVLPGFSLNSNIDNQIWAFLSVKGNKSFRTTVSRSSLEEDDEYFNVAEICGKLLFDHVEGEVKRIAEQSGRPLSQASTAGQWVFRSIYRSTELPKIQKYLKDMYETLPLVVIERMEQKLNKIKSFRDLKCQKEISIIDYFWTIESRLVDYLGVISRDLGKELSLNDFLGTLAPEFRDPRINPVISDPHQFTFMLHNTHNVIKAEFSHRYKQTLIEWHKNKRQNSNNFDVYYYSFYYSTYYFPYGDFLERLPDKIVERITDEMEEILAKINVFKEGSEESFLRTITESYIPLIIAPIEGDISKVNGVIARVALIIDPSHPIADVVKLLDENISNLQVNTDQFERIAKLLLGKALIAYAIIGRQVKPSIKHRIYMRDYDYNYCFAIWKEVVDDLNILFGSSVKRFPDKLENIIGNESTWFDASSYWRDWENWHDWEIDD